MRTISDEHIDAVRASIPGGFNEALQNKEMVEDEELEPLKDGWTNDGIMRCVIVAVLVIILVLAIFFATRSR